MRRCGDPQLQRAGRWRPPLPDHHTARGRRRARLLPPPLLLSGSARGVQSPAADNERGHADEDQGASARAGRSGGGGGGSGDGGAGTGAATRALRSAPDAAPRTRPTGCRLRACAELQEIEDEMARTQKNKATSGHLGLLKAKLAKLRRELLEDPAGGGGGGKGEGFDVKSTGIARVGLVGFPSVGKSTLLTKLTGTFSEAASYEFTTLTCVPGVIRYMGAKIQLLDLPGIIEGAKDGKGRGRQVIATARTCSLILIVLDVMKPMTHKALIEKELEGFGIRINKKPPNIVFRKKEKGGINFNNSATSGEITLETVKSILSEYKSAWRGRGSPPRAARMRAGRKRPQTCLSWPLAPHADAGAASPPRTVHNADVYLKEEVSTDDLVDVVEMSEGKGRGVVYIPVLYVLNKIDQITKEELELVDKMENCCPICAQHEWNLDGLLERIWEKLNLKRIYTKPKGMMPDFEEPVVLPASKAKVEDFCMRIHKTLLNDLKFAQVWGLSAKHKPQRVGKEHILEDEDVVQIVKKI